MIDDEEDVYAAAAAKIAAEHAQAAPEPAPPQEAAPEDDPYVRAAQAISSRFALPQDAIDREPTAADYAALPVMSAMSTVGTMLTGLGMTETGRDFTRFWNEDVPPKARQNLGGQVLEGIGSTVPFLVGGAAAGSTRGAALTIGAMGMLAEGGGAYQRAMDSGATPEQALAAGWLTAPIGLTEIIPASKWAGRVGKLLFRVGEAEAQKAASLGIKSVFKTAVLEGVEESLQEVGQTYWEDLIAQQIHSPEDVASILEAAKVAPSSLIVGMLFGAVSKHYHNKAVKDELVQALLSDIGSSTAVPRGTSGNKLPTEGEETPEQSAVPEAENEPKTEAAGESGKPGESSDASGQPAASALPGGRIEAPDEDLVAAGRRMQQATVAQLEPGKKARRAPLNLRYLESSEANTQHAARLGLRVANFEAPEDFPAEGFYDRETKTILLNDRADAEAQQRGLFRHELTHFVEDQYPEVHRAYVAAINAIEPGWLERQAADRVERESKLRKAPSTLSPERAQSEAVAETLQSLPNVTSLLEDDRDLAVRVALHRPGLIRSMVDMLIDFAGTLGLTERKSISRHIREINEVLDNIGTRTEQAWGAQKALKLLIKVAELEKGLLAETPVAQPRANVAEAIPTGPAVTETAKPTPAPAATAQNETEIPNAVPPVRRRVPPGKRTQPASEARSGPLPVGPSGPSEGVGERVGSGTPERDAGQGTAAAGLPGEGAPSERGRSDGEGDRERGDRGTPDGEREPGRPAAAPSGADLDKLIEAEIAAAFEEKPTAEPKAEQATAPALPLEPEPAPVPQKSLPPPDAGAVFGKKPKSLPTVRFKRGDKATVGTQTVEVLSKVEGTNDWLVKFPDGNVVPVTDNHLVRVKPAPVIPLSPEPAKPDKARLVPTRGPNGEVVWTAQPITPEPAPPPVPPSEIQQKPPTLSAFDQAIDDLRGMFAIPLDPALDADKYARAKPRFETVAESIGADAQDTTSLVRALVLYLRDVAKFTSDQVRKMAPYIKQFAMERFEKPPVYTIEEAAPAPATSNFVITTDDKIGTGGPKQRAEQNIRAIEILKDATNAGRLATLGEQKELVQYVGWGASYLANTVFGDPITGELKPEWKSIGERIRNLVTPEEYAAMRASTRNAHYTSDEIVRAMWATMQKLGFAGGNVLEPGMGVGHFIGLMPKELRERVAYTGVELDIVTAGIAKLLYPEASIHNVDYADFRAPRDFFDAAIGNPPFDENTVRGDPEYASENLALHDFFFAKTLDRVKPGGLVMFITSRYSMDKLNDRARSIMQERADLVGAVRLPQSAFQKNAGTAVVTDILVLQRRATGQPQRGAKWDDIVEIDVEGQKTRVNGYYQRNPQMVMGTHSLQGTMRKAFDYTVKPDLSRPIGEQVREALATLEPATTELPQSTPDTVPVPKRFRVTDKPVQEGSFHIHEGTLYVREEGSDVEVKANTRAEPTEWSSRDVKVLRAYVPVRDAVLEVFRAQTEEGGDLAAAQANLHEVYDSFVEQFGPINEQKITETSRITKSGENVVIIRYPQFDAFKMDPDAYRVGAIEDYDVETGTATKTRFFSEATIAGEKAPDIRNANDAMLVTLNERGKLDLYRVAELAGLSREAVIAELGDLIYEVPNGDFVVADEYLSGNVRVKLAQAKDAAKFIDARFQRNVDALEKVIPPDLVPSKIAALLGSAWIEPSDVEDFIREKLGIRSRIFFSGATNIWSVNFAPGEERSFKANDEWGTPEYNAKDLLQSILMGQAIRVTMKIKDGDKDRTVTNEPATLAAQEKAAKIHEAFQGWIWSDEARTTRLARKYNDTYNSVVDRKYDGSHLTFAGMSQFFKMRKHQRDVVWRIISSGNTYMAHGVGAGKTLAMAAAAIEMRRLGLVRKPMFVVPNHMLQQFATETLLAFPGAKILVADEREFSADRRKRFVAKVATGDWDAVFIKFSSFEDVQPPGDSLREYIEGQLDELNTAQAQANKGDRVTIKMIEGRRKRLEGKLKKITAEKDEGIKFDELGVDFLFVDEAHNYRKLDITTSRENVKGITPTGADKSIDFFLKINWLAKQRPNRSLVMASGTPITNTMGELYTIQRYMDPIGMRAAGIEHFDAWAAQFGRETEAWETTAQGRLKKVTRFAKFVNLADLSQMVRKFMDVVRVSDLDYIKRPEKTVENVLVERSADQAAALEAMGNALDRAQGKEKGAMVLKVMTDSRHLSMDPRFGLTSIGAAAHRGGEVASKLTKLVDNVYDIWLRTKDQELEQPMPGGKTVKVRANLTQMIFSSLGLPTVLETRGFSAYTFIREELVRRGVPREEIAFMQDYENSAKKLKLFADMNTGKKRILIGSTERMGTGVNAQRLLYALHHLDIPWLPADVEQREGRIWRQKNLNPNVRILRYSTKATFDEAMWGTLARKQGFIDSFMLGDPEMREMEDLDGEAGTFAMARAMTSGDPLFIEQAETDSKVRKLAALASAHAQKLETRKAELSMARYSLRSASAKADGATELLKTLPTDPEAYETAEFEVMHRGEWVRMVGEEQINKALDEEQARIFSIDPEQRRERYFPLVRFQGLTVSTNLQDAGLRPFWSTRLSSEKYQDDVLTLSWQGIVNRLLKVGAERDKAVTQRDHAKTKIEALEPTLNEPFPQADALRDARTRLFQITRELEAKATAANAPKASDADNDGGIDEDEQLEQEDEAEGRFAIPLGPKSKIGKKRLERIYGAFGKENADQTARTSQAEKTRTLQAAVRAARLHEITPEKHAPEYSRARRELREDKGLKAKLVQKLIDRSEFSKWETIALSLVADRAAQTMWARATPEAIEEAIRLRWLYEDLRRRQAQVLGVIRDPIGIYSGPEALTSVVSIANRKNRERIQKIMERLNDTTLSKDARFALSMDLEQVSKDEAKTTAKVMRKLRDAGFNPELMTREYFADPVMFSRAARIASTAKAGFNDWFLEWRIASMLGGPMTQIANTTGNAASTVYTQVISRVAEALVNIGAQNPDAASFSELPSYFKAWLPGLAHAGHNFLLALRTEMPVFEIELMEKGVAIPGISNQNDALEAGRQSIPGVFGRILRAPSLTLLQAVDEFFKTLTAHTQAVALAHRAAKKEGLTGAEHTRRVGQILQDYDHPVHYEAWLTAKEVTFQDAHDSKVLRAILTARKGLDDTVRFPVGSILLPFVRTPYRIFQRGLGIPFAPVVAVHHMVTGKWTAKSGLRERDIAESVLGLAITLAVMWSLRDDDDDDLPRMTGSRSPDYGEALLQERTAPAQSVRVGDRWFSYARLEPLAVALTTIVDFAESVHGAAKQGKGAQVEAGLGRLGPSLMEQAAGKTWLRTFGDIYKAVTQPQSGRTARLARDTLVTPMIPNIVRAPARATDPFLRQNPVRRTDDQGVWERSARSIPYEALPLASRAPEIRYDLWGREVLRNGRTYGHRLLSPTPESGIPDVSSLDILLLRYNDRIEAGDFPGEKKAFPRPPDFDYQGRDHQTHQWNDEEYARLSRESGQLAATKLLRTRNLHFNNPTPDDIERIKKALSAARKTVREKMIAEKARR